MNMPDWIQPAKATLTYSYFWSKDWSYEEKLDGERIVAVKDKTVSIYSRNRILLNNTYPEIVTELKKLEGRWWIDGEIVAFDHQVTSFKKLQRRLQIKDPVKALNSDIEVFLYVFDLMYLNGHDLRSLPYKQRRVMLWQLLKPRGHLRIVRPQKPIEQSFTLACKRGWEGLVVKNLDSPYESKRTTNWLKFKCSKSQELIIIGYTDPHGARIRFGALLLGYYHDGELKYAGRVGTGFDETTLERLYVTLSGYTTDQSPLSENIATKGVHWVQPILVAQVGFTEWTNDNKLRHPRYLGLRDDKSPQEVIKEES